MALHGATGESTRAPGDASVADGQKRTLNNVKTR